MLLKPTKSSHLLKTVAEQEHLPLVLHTFSELDYGTSVPLSLVLSPQPNVPVLPIILPFQQSEILLRAGMVYIVVSMSKGAGHGLYCVVHV